MCQFCTHAPFTVAATKNMKKEREGRLAKNQTTRTGFSEGEIRAGLSVLGDVTETLGALNWVGLFRECPIAFSLH